MPTIARDKYRSIVGGSRLQPVGGSAKRLSRESTFGALGGAGTLRIDPRGAVGKAGWIWLRAFREDNTAFNRQVLEHFGRKCFGIVAVKNVPDPGWK
jgi:hypothetical protein